ncbi:outer membrane beta-barrel protein [Sphingomonas sp. H160509]|uniref:outer membrane beta-barrel protein n=1 Tax=Sphingomonas sp. H160509 TaxID=2955313 RepID=UPI0020983A7B|nr:outer membrane beta-barrel protein [Sphingomonas sp. H160509]MDD1453161.1 outer membrane beta-barrel protein [Sphingomonas sp. H160509]
MRKPIAVSAAVALIGLPSVALGQTTDASSGTLTLPDPGTSVVTDRGSSTLIGIPSLRLPRGDILGSGSDGSVVNIGSGRRGATVATRARPDFDAVGIPVGGFTLFPVGSLGLTYDGNVFNGRQNQVADVSGNARLAAVVRSNWSRHQIVLDGFVNQRAYATYTSESGITYRARAQGRYDIGAQTKASVEVNRERVFLQRSSLTEVLPTRQPVRYDLTSGAIGLSRDIGRLRVSGQGYVGRYDFNDAERVDGTPISQRFRTYDLYRGSLQVGYALDAGPVVFVRGIADTRRYRFSAPPIDRDSSTIEVLAGLSSDITPLLRGRIAVGYISADFKQPNIASRSAPSFDVDLDYLATELTTVHLSGRRYFQNVSLADSPGVLSTEAVIGADHELLRNLIISGEVVYRQTDFIASASDGSALGSEARAQLFINRRLRLNGAIGYFYNRRDAVAVDGQVFKNTGQIQATVGLSFAL